MAKNKLKIKFTEGSLTQVEMESQLTEEQSIIAASLLLAKVIDDKKTPTDKLDVLLDLVTLTNKFSDSSYAAIIVDDTNCDVAGTVIRQNNAHAMYHVWQAAIATLGKVISESDDAESCLEDTLETIKRTVSEDTDNPTMRKVVH